MIASQPEPLSCVDARSISRARAKAATAGFGDRLVFERIAAENIPAADRFDIVRSFNCIHDMANPRDALANIRRALKLGGVLMWSEADASDRIEERYPGQPSHGRKVHGATSRSAFAHVALLPAQRNSRHRRHRHIRRGVGLVSTALRHGHAGSRSQKDCAVRCYTAS